MIAQSFIVSCEVPECAGDAGFVSTSGTPTGAREEAAQYGWIYKNGCDFCPKHHGRGGRVSHHITGTVHGSVVQAGDIRGPVILGR